MTIQKVTRAKPQTEEVPAGLVGYIILRVETRTTTFGDKPEWYVTDSPFREVPVWATHEEAVNRAEDGEYIIQIDLPLMGKE